MSFQLMTPSGEIQVPQKHVLYEQKRWMTSAWESWICWTFKKISHYIAFDIYVDVMLIKVLHLSAI
jgi:hypothetical protein